MKKTKLKGCLCPACRQRLLAVDFCHFKILSQEKEAKMSNELVKRLVIKHGAQMLIRGNDYYLEHKTVIAKDYFDKIVGIISVINWGDGQFEITSHAVDPQRQGLGIGQKLWLYLRRELRPLQEKHLFLFTNRCNFYQRLGFQIVPPETFSAKIQSDCCHCPLGINGPGKPPCAEVAMGYSDWWKHRSLRRC